ncbi:DedA family protein [Candidatus Hepatobacter penaei]|uniref:DedA family protein n=1 Tax=Candidatus Hepatobacter penaei TaxID=1274402 RepID=UPI000697310D|nr:DedA family protein [Candidatus Hepatobacter penaei]TGW14930.1 DedA family protein [bacterium NHP-B]
MEDFVAQWGYWAVFLGSLIEGESVILPAGYFASQGVLDLSKVMIIAFFGTLIADQGLFLIGHVWGKRVLSFFPKLDPPAQKAFLFLKQYGIFYILTFRFIYGVRIISPLIIGTAGFPFGQFVFLNFVAAALWSVLSCGAGYVFGSFIMYHLSPLQRFFFLGGLGIACLCWLLWKAYLFYKKEFA